MIPSKIQRQQSSSERAKTNLKRVDGSSNCSSATISTRVVGVIQSHHVGLVRAGVRIKVMARTDLRVRWPIGEPRRCIVGQTVVAVIPAEAVRLEAGIFRRGRQRWNRWIGRIVLVESEATGLLYTVKVHGENWTLKGYGPVVGAREPSRTWDMVNIVVDPEKVDLTISELRSHDREGHEC